MKRLIFASLVVALFSGTVAFAQSNGSYVDDVYYNGSQAQKDAKADAKKQKKQQEAQQGDAEYYSSTNGYNDGGYNNNGNAQVYNNSYGNDDDAYIDYDDDSYTSRIRRFYYPMSSVGYWGGVYSPFWYDPFYSNPYYGWGGWYTPGFSVGMGWGWGGGPYWSNCWGINTWFGYGGFGSWYYPYGGWGWGGGYGLGYWNGYYAGANDGRYGYYGRTVNYGPRGARNGMLSAGAYGRASNMRAMNTNNGGTVMQPMRGRAGNAVMNRDNAVNLNGATMNRGGMQVGDQRVRMNGNQRAFENNNQAIRLNDRGAAEINQGAVNGGRSQMQEAAPVRRNGFFGNMFRGNPENMNRGGGMERAQPSRSYNAERAQPSRSFSSPAPSRSFSSPSPARSSGSFNGGGARMSGGRR
ncbi:hypothetical protein [Taibaiella koreensis]|uniref:hypothetical protein n=1 Tax=Taibaiella koreensis TaxID=1268548 RepID=UPI000E59D124|nr:hypothetical protein [Taibaiella koreensis]